MSLGYFFTVIMTAIVLGIALQLQMILPVPVLGVVVLLCVPKKLRKNIPLMCIGACVNDVFSFFPLGTSMVIMTLFTVGTAHLRHYSFLRGKITIREVL